MPARCPLCPSPKLPILGHGPLPCPILFIGEGPGKQEDTRRDRDGSGYPFIGDSGRELDGLYLPLSGLTREEVRVCNVVCCASRNYDNPSLELAQCCSSYWLPDEFRRCRPSVVVTLGAIALQTLFPGHDLEHQHGIPFRGQYGNWTGIVVPMYHPAAGLRKAEYMTALLEDFAALRPLLDGDEVPIPTDRFPNPFYFELRGVDDTESYLARCPDQSYPFLAMDTEYVPVKKGQSTPFCMSLSILPGTGGVVLADNLDALLCIDRWLHRRGTHPTVFLHHALADLDPLRTMRIPLPRYIDTMMLAYHLGNQPQSLKVLAYRLCGMRMQDFTDLVRPYAIEDVLNWAALAIERLTLPPAKLAANGGESGPLVDLTSSHPLACPLEPRTGFGRPQCKKAYREWLEGQPDALLALRGATLCPGWTHWEMEWAEVLVKAVNECRTGHEPLLTKLNRLINDLTSKDDCNPWTRWGDWPEDHQLTCLRVTGTTDIPRGVISRVPWTSVIPYSAADADSTLRIARELLRRTRRVSKSESL